MPQQAPGSLLSSTHDDRRPDIPEVVPPPVPAMSADGVPPGPPQDSADVWDRLQQLPSMNEDPLVWDHRAGGFVRSSQVAGGRGAPDPRVAAPADPAPPAASAPAAAAAPAPPPPPTRPAPPPVDPTMVAAGPPAGSGEANRWGQGVVGAGTAKRHVVIDGGSAAPLAGAAAVGAAGAAAARPPVAPAPVAAPRPAVAAPRPAPRPAARPAPAAPPPRQKRPRRRRRVGRTILVLCLVVPLLLLAGGFAFGWVKFSQIPRVPVASVLSPQTGSGTNFLVVGTDSREGINPGDPNADAFIGGGGATGARTDSIMVLRIDGGQQSLLSIPRDLWVTDPATGQLGRINSTYNAGPANLIQTVQNLGIPIHHYVEINFVSFGKLVDAVGGIDVTFANPSRDTASGLVIEEAGTHHLDGTQALAYVRSRHFEELKDGVWVEDPLSDLGRVARQRAFLASLLTEVTSTKNPFALSSITDAMSVGMKIDDAMTFLDALRLGWQFRGGFNPTSDTLPVSPRTTSGGAAVLDLRTAEAAPLIAQYQ